MPDMMPDLPNLPGRPDPDRGAGAQTLTVSYMTLPVRRKGRRQNVGDDMIRLGVQNLMRCALGPHAVRIVDVAGEDEIPPGTDVLVVCGTPQVIDGQDRFPTLRGVHRAAAARVPVRINLGAGAFYHDAFGPDLAAADAAFAERVRTGALADTYAAFGGFHLVTTRDMAATLALRAVGVAAQPLPCPGFFAPLFQPRPLLRHPALLVSSLNGGAGFWNTVGFDVHGLHERLHATRPDTVFISHDQEDSEMLSDLGIPYVEFETAEELVGCLAAHDRILSLRVHGALPAWSLGLDVTLLGIDRRAWVGRDFGALFRVLPLRGEGDLERALTAGLAARPAQDEASRGAWLARNLAAYVANIRGTVEALLGPLPPAEDAALPPSPAYASPMPRGTYLKRLFHSTEAAFDVPLGRLRSEHRHTVADGVLTIDSDGAVRTLLFGPYVTLPHGRWRAVLHLAATDGEPLPVMTLQVVKGTRTELLGSGAIPSQVDGAPVTISVPFENPRDTGFIECVLRAQGPVPAGRQLHIRSLRFERDR